MISHLLQFLILVIIWAQLANCDQYGSRMRTEALARSKIDGRIAAILNTGPELPKLYFSNYDWSNSENINNEKSQVKNEQMITKKFGDGLPKNDGSSAEEIPIY